MCVYVMASYETSLNRATIFHTDTVTISFGQYLSGPEIFSINEHNYNLSLNAQLDYETPANYSFTVEAVEMVTTDALTSTATVIIEVLPVNEYTPEIVPTTRLELLNLLYF